MQFYVNCVHESLSLCRQLFFQQKTLVKLVRAYQPIIPTTLGEHIMNRRKILGLLQKDIALLLAVGEETISNWETNKYVPHISLFPRIAKFLEYEWWQFDTGTLIGKIQDYRFRHGLTCYRFGLLLNVHGTTVCGWEVKGRIPLNKIVEKLNVLLKPKPLE